MYSCFLCQSKFQSQKEIVDHVAKFCSSDQSRFHCGQAGCIRVYNSRASFKRHLTLKHSFQDTSLNEPRELDNAAVESLNPPVQSSSSNDLVSVSNLPDTLTSHFSNFLSSLYRNPQVPRNVVQVVVNEFEKFISVDLSNVLFSRFCELGGDLINDEAKTIFKNTLAHFKNSIKDLRSEHLRLSLYTKLGTYVAPLEIIIGQNYKRKRIKGGNQQLLSVNSTFQMVELSLVLKQFLSLPNLMYEIQEYVSNLEAENSLITNVMQGSVWKNMSKDFAVTANNEYHLPIVVYYDDFVAGNPLSGHSPVVKVGGVYASFPFLPPEYVSQLDCIFLLGLFLTADRVKLGNNVIFSKIIEELNKLCLNGITVSTDSFTGTVKFHVVAVTGDNLALHSMLGFVESFSGNYSCRFCRIHKNEMHKQVFEDPDIVRTLENYEKDLETKATGVKELCVFKELIGFDLFRNVPADIMHDWWLGCCIYTMQFVVTSLIKNSQFLSISLFEKIIDNFNFGPDNGSKPTSSMIFHNGLVRLKLSASEMMVFVRYFSVMIGEYIPSTLKVWALYIALRTVSERLQSYYVTASRAEVLKHDIAEFHSLYLELTNEHLRPKFHFLTHYPTLLLKFGPLAWLSTFRFEAKHRVCKLISQSSVNKINICKTIAIKNQLILNDIFLKSSLNKKVWLSKKRKLSTFALNEIKSNIDFPFEGVRAFSLNWIKVRGNLIRLQDVVTVDILESNDYLPLFGLVKKIVLIEPEKIYLYLNTYHTDTFYMHRYVFTVKETNDYIFPEISDLLNQVPNTLTKTTNDFQYVTLRLPID